MCASPDKVQCSYSSKLTIPNTNPIMQSSNLITGSKSNTTGAYGVSTITVSSYNITIVGCDLSKEFTSVPNTGCAKYYRFIRTFLTNHIFFIIYGLYRCINNNLASLSCPSGFLFDISKKICNLAEKVRCSSTSTGGCNSSVDFIPLPNDCHRFFRCVNNNLLILQCPIGFQFNQKIKICERNNGTCIRSTTSLMITTRPVNGNR
jgi:hypothetical protein